MKVNDIIIRPLFTEKMTQLEDLERKYAFQVSLGSNKIDIKNAVEKRFDVEVQKVATMNRLGKTSDSPAVGSAYRTVGLLKCTPAGQPRHRTWGAGRTRQCPMVASLQTF